MQRWDFAYIHGFRVSRITFFPAWVIELNTVGFVFGVQSGSVGLMNSVAEAATGSFDAGLYVTINNDGSTVITCARSEMGQGVRTSLPMIVADELEADWSKVKIVQAVADAKYGNQNTDGSSHYNLYIFGNYISWEVNELQDKMLWKEMIS